MTKQTGAVILGLALLVITMSLVLRHPIMGRRDVTAPPPIEVVDTTQQDDQIVITVRNNESNPVTGDAGYSLVNPAATEIYEAVPAHFDLAPAATKQLTFDLPPNRPEDVSVQTWAREQIAYLDPEAAIIQGLSLREQPDNGVTVEYAALIVNEQRRTQPERRFSLGERRGTRAGLSLRGRSDVARSSRGNARQRDRSRISARSHGSS